MEFENKFKKELQRREIKPSSDSWDRLRERLDEDSQPKRKNYSWLWKVAAVAILFLGLGTFIEHPFDSPQVVEEFPVEQILQEHDPTGAELVVSEEESEVKPEERSSQEMYFPRGEIAHKKEIQTVDLPQQQPVIKSELAIVQPEVLTKVERVENTESIASEELAQVTNAEIDALLATAREDLSRDSIAYASQFPGAEDLLEEVEYELDESFRRKVFEVLKDGYSRAKTAVANRDF